MNTAEQQRLKDEYNVYITELRRLKAEKYGEQLSFNFEEETDASTSN